MKLNKLGIVAFALALPLVGGAIEQKPVTTESLATSTLNLARKAATNRLEVEAEILAQATVDLLTNKGKTIKPSKAVCHTDLECAEYDRRNKK